MPFFFRKLAEKLMNGKAEGQFTQSTAGGNPFERHNQRPRPDGKVRVEYMPPKQGKTKSGAHTAGEFIDFEEVK